MFDPTKITTFIGLAAVAIWAICYVSNKPKYVLICTFLVALVAIVTAAALQLTEHGDGCANVPALRLNEVCAEGTRCDGGKDFIEVFNPNNTSVNLACFAVGNQRSARHGGTRLDAKPVLLQTGNLSPGGVRAWDADQLSFRISREKGDRIELFKLKLESGKSVEFIPLEKEQVLIDNSASYWLRASDGSGNWHHMSNKEVEELKKAGKKAGTFGRSEQ